MSNIYIQEPPTSGKVLLKTTVGDIDIELWTREAPKACRNFIQLCMEGYYDGTIFHRLVKGFIVQGGDPNGDGTGGESIYGETFKDEFHSRLRFARRGLVAMANAGKDDNASQFFFTLAPCTELQNKHTIFGKVTGDTIYNMLKLEDGLVDENERPHYPQKIIRVDVLNNPFEDLIARVVKVEKKEKKVHREKGVKNFGLLSFGDEAEEDENETTEFVQKNISKGKSTHDVLDDPKLSKDTLKLEQQPQIEKKRAESPDIENYSQSEEDEDKIKEKAARIKNKLKGSSNKIKEQPAKKVEKSSSDSDSDYLNAAENERKIVRKKKAEEIRNEIVSLKKEYSKDKKYKSELLNKERQKEEEKVSTNEMFKEYLNEKEKYSKLKELPKKGTSREQFTLSLLAKFKTKLETVKVNNQDDDKSVQSDASNGEEEEDGEVSTKKRKGITDKDDNGDNEENVDREINTDAWLSHTLRFVERGSTLAKDASTKEDDWYDVYDPRNPINKRKREKKKKTNNN